MTERMPVRGNQVVATARERPRSTTLAGRYGARLRVLHLDVA